MRSTVCIASLVLSMVSSSFAAPTPEANTTPLSLSIENLNSTIESASALKCPSIGGGCGMVSYTSGDYVSFGQGICMPLGYNIHSIYVANCYCSLWMTCTGHSGTDVYVGGMMMCERPKTVKDFDKEVRYISCGGLQ